MYLFIFIHRRKCCNWKRIHEVVRSITMNFRSPSEPASDFDAGNDLARKIRTNQSVSSFNAHSNMQISEIL